MINHYLIILSIHAGWMHIIYLHLDVIPRFETWIITYQQLDDNSNFILTGLNVTATAVICYFYLFDCICISAFHLCTKRTGEYALRWTETSQIIAKTHVVLLSIYKLIYYAKVVYNTKLSVYICSQTFDWCNIRFATPTVNNLTYFMIYSCYVVLHICIFKF